jgi:hypothetical protein
MKTAPLFTFLATMTLMGSASAAWQRLPQVNVRPADIASKAIDGTSIKSSSGIGQAASFLSEDITSTSSLGAGASEAVLQLSRQQVVEMASFVNGGAEGKVTISGSTDNSEWMNLGQDSFSAGDRFVTVSFAGAQVKYVKATLETTTGGSISSFKLTGSETNQDYTVGSSSSSSSTINLANGIGGAQAIYAYPTPTNVGETDYDVSVFRFPKTNEKYRTIIYDLGAVRSIKTFAATYSQARPVRLEVFAFDSLGEKKDWRGKLTLDPAIFDNANPVASGEDSSGSGMIKLNSSSLVSAQYVALRFEPSYNGVAFSGSDWSDFLSFAMEPYRQGAVILGLNESSMIGADTGAPLVIYDVGIIPTGGGSYNPIAGAPGAGQPGQPGSPDQANNYNSGPPPWYTGAFNSYTSARTGGTGGNPFVPPTNNPPPPPPPGNVIIRPLPQPNPNPNNPPQTPNP